MQSFAFYNERVILNAYKSQMLFWGIWERLTNTRYCFYEFYFMKIVKLTDRMITQ
jgi:hypothetical protein